MFAHALLSYFHQRNSLYSTLSARRCVYLIIQESVCPGPELTRTFGQVPGPRLFLTSHNTRCSVLSLRRTR